MARWLGRLAADPVVISIEAVFVRANYLDSSGVVRTVATAAGAVVVADDLQARDVRGVALLGCRRWRGRSRRGGGGRVLVVEVVGAAFVVATAGVVGVSVTWRRRIRSAS